MKSTAVPPTASHQKVNQAVRIFRFLKQNHENQADGQSIGHIGQEINGLIKPPAVV